MNYRRYLQQIRVLLPNGMWMHIKRYPNSEVPSFIKNLEDVPNRLNKEMELTKRLKRHTCIIFTNTEDFGFILQYLKQKGLKYTLEDNHNFYKQEDTLMEQMLGPETKDSPNFKHLK